MYLRDRSAQTIVTAVYLRDRSAPTIVTAMYLRDRSAQTIVTAVYLRDRSAPTIVTAATSFTSFLSHPVTACWHWADQSQPWPLTPGAWRGSHRATNGMTWSGNRSTAKAGITPTSDALAVKALHRPMRRSHLQKKTELQRPSTSKSLCKRPLWPLIQGQQADITSLMFSSFALTKSLKVICRLGETGSQAWKILPTTISLFSRHLVIFWHANQSEWICNPKWVNMQLT